MIYRDYSRKAGEWIPNEYGGRENLEALAFLRQAERGGLRRPAGRRRPSPRNRPRGPRSRGRSTWAGSASASSGTWAGCTTSSSSCSHEPVHRKYHHNQLTFGLLYAWTENFVLPLSHDEVVHGKRSLARKMPGDDWQRFANLRLLYAFMWAYPGKKLLFMGGEFGQSRRVEPRPGAGLAAPRHGPVPPRGPAAHEGPERRLPERAVALRARLRIGGVPVDGLQRLGAEHRDVLPLLPEPGATLRLRVQLHPGGPREAIASASPAPASIARRSIRTPPCTAAATSATRAASRASRPRGTGSRTRWCSRCRRSRPSG